MKLIKGEMDPEFETVELVDQVKVVISKNDQLGTG